MKDESQKAVKDDGKEDAVKERKLKSLELSEGLSMYLTQDKREKLGEIIQVFEQWDDGFIQFHFEQIKGAIKVIEDENASEEEKMSAQTSLLEYI